MKLTVKKIMAPVIAGLMLFVAAPLCANAETQNVLSYSVTNGQATIVYCDKAAVGEFTIPDTLGGFPVTSIDDSAFSDCNKLTSITVPDSVMSIGFGAFRLCRFLKSIFVDEGNLVYTSENGVLFNKSKTELIRYPSYKTDKSFSIPNGVTSLSEDAFYSCTELTSITFPNSMLSIGERAFEFCIAIKSISIPNSVVSIGEGAFNDCYKLKRVTLPNSITRIVAGAFSGTAWYNKQHDGLIYAGMVAYGYKGDMPENTAIVLKPGTRGISDGAFSYCEGLASITVPASVKRIGDGAFHGLYSLKSIYIDAGNPDYSSENGVLFNKSKTELILYPRGKNNLSYTIPNSVKSIADEAFSLCSDLTSVTIPNSVKSIGNEAFFLCSKLKSITIPNSVTSIGDRAFYWCDGLTNISIPNNLKSIGDSVFSACDGLTSITIPSSIMSIGDEAFLYCTGLKSITIPNSVTSIGDIAFYHCTGLTNITIPGSVKSIGGKAFAECAGLTSINVNKANKVYASENGVLFNKSKTKLIQYPLSKTGSSYTMPNSVKSIGGRAFDGSSDLTNITIPNSVTTIGDGAFNNTAWYNKQPDGVVYAGKVAYGYKGEMPANTAIVLKPGTKGIAEGAFEPETSEEDNPDLIGVSIPNTVTNIGDRAFSGCTDLKNVTIPKSVVSIGEQAFGYWLLLDYVDKISDLTFSCFENSAGQRYAVENGFAYNILPDSADSTDHTATTENIATTIDGSTRTTSDSTTVNGSTSTTVTTTTINRTTGTTATTLTTNSRDKSKRVIVRTVILTIVALSTVAATAVLIIAKKKRNNT